VSELPICNKNPTIDAISMLSRIRGIRGEKDEEEASVAESAAGSNPASLGNNPKDGAIIYVPAPSTKKKKHQSPQEAIDDFWAKFNTKTPGRGACCPMKPVVHETNDLAASNILPKEKVRRCSWDEQYTLCNHAGRNRLQRR
jgi:hypothetical protein